MDGENKLGMGIEPSHGGDVSPLRRFSADSLPPFSLLGGYDCRVNKSLAGNEFEKSGSGTGKVYAVRFSQALERRYTVYVLGRSAALLMSRLPISVFRHLQAFRYNLFFLLFFFNLERNFHGARRLFN